MIDSVESFGEDHMCFFCLRLTHAEWALKVVADVPSRVAGLFRIYYGTKLAVALPIEKVFESAGHCFGDHFSADF